MYKTLKTTESPQSTSPIMMKAIERDRSPISSPKVSAHKGNLRGLSVSSSSSEEDIDRMPPSPILAHRKKELPPISGLATKPLFAEKIEDASVFKIYRGFVSPSGVESSNLPQSTQEMALRYSALTHEKLPSASPFLRKN